jgi:sugar/nucleoside kinase (ribokinase family)
MMIPVWVIGELNVDLILTGCTRAPAFGTEVTVDGYAMTLGSASAICAVGLARLGRPVSFAGKVGADSWGDFCVHTLRSAGVDVEAVRSDARVQTGVTVALSGPHDRALVTYPGATEALSIADLPDAIGTGSGHLHVSSFFLQSAMRPSWRTVFERARSGGWTVSLDPGCDPSATWASDLRELLPLVNVLLPNELELTSIAHLRSVEEALRALHTDHTIVVAKLGAAGSIALEGDRMIQVAPPPVAGIDTTGAGDSFNAGFLHAWLDRHPLRACMRAGVACGALSTRALGGITAQPDGNELAACLEAAW